MENKKKHPFTFTLGEGPYKYVGFGKISISETQGAVYHGVAMDSGCGTCDHCGHGIMNIYVVETADGKRHGVGSECILKFKNDGDFTNLTDFEREIKQQKRKAGQVNREKQRVKLKQEVEKLVEENKEMLSLINIIGKRTQTARDYCDWYLKTGHSLNAYKIFKNKLISWGIK